MKNKKLWFLVLIIILLASLISNIVLATRLNISNTTQAQLEAEVAASLPKLREYERLSTYLKENGNRDISNVLDKAEETRNSVYVFFKVNTPYELIRSCVGNFGTFTNTQIVDFVSAAQAKEQYISYNPDQAEMVIDQNIPFPASALYKSENIDEFTLYVQSKAQECRVDNVRSLQGEI